MVRVEIAEPEPGVMVAGEKEQLKLLGRPAQESEIGLVEEPDCALAVTVTFPDCPAGRVMAAGDALKNMVDAGGDGGSTAAQAGL